MSEQEVITPEKFKEEMEAVVKSSGKGTDLFRRKGLMLMESVLRPLGYGDGVQVYEENEN